MADVLADNPVLTLFLVVALGMSPARSGGLIAGFVGNKSLLAFATSRAADERVNEGYTRRFAVDTILKVLLVQVIVGLGGQARWSRGRWADCPVFWMTGVGYSSAHD